MLMPRQSVPPLALPLVGGGIFDLAKDHGSRGTLLAFYRGLHCPVCAGYLGELERLTPAFAERGVKTVAISSDSEMRARTMAEKVKAASMPIAWGLPIDEARGWGLYISASRGTTSIGIEEPALFSEPGLFLVNADGTLYFASVQTMPFARPDFAALLGALDFVIAKNYPARGEVAAA